VNDDPLFQRALAEAASQEARRKKAAPRGPGVAWTRGGLLVLDKKLIETLRAEFLQLMRAAEEAAGPSSDYDLALKVKDALATWRLRFDDLVYEHIAKSGAWELIASSPRIWKSSKGELYEEERQKLNDWQKHWDEKIRKACWNLSIELTSMPLERKPISKEGAFATYRREHARWIAKTKRGALGAWKVLLEFIGWLGEPPRPAVNVGTDEVATIEGFRTRLVKFGKSDFDEAAIKVLPGALKIFRERAGKVLPWILRSMLPLELEFQCGLDQGGKYHGSQRRPHISICLTNVASGKKDTMRSVAHVLAHEMGHHTWKTHLHENARKFWQAAIRADRGPLDLRKTLACWRKAVGQDAWNESIWYFKDWLYEHDPVTGLKIDALVHSEWLREEGLREKISTISDLNDLVDHGRAVVHTPRNPITVYAHKNDEEAFCEALGLLIAYGPRALLSEVRGWLSVAVPDIRIV